MDLFTPGPARLPHDGEYLYRIHAASPLPPGELRLSGRESVLLPRVTHSELQPLEFFLLLIRRGAAGEPDCPVWPRMGVQPGDLPEHNSHRGTEKGCLTRGGKYATLS